MAEPNACCGVTGGHEAFCDSDSDDAETRTECNCGETHAVCPDLLPWIQQGHALDGLLIRPVMRLVERMLNEHYPEDVFGGEHECNVQEAERDPGPRALAHLRSAVKLLGM